MNIAINGLGRIGRMLVKQLIDKSDINIVAINDLMPIDMAAYFLKYDSTYGGSSLGIKFESDQLIINGKSINYTSFENIENLPWSNINIDIVVNCSGTNKTKPQLEKYLDLGIPKVILSSPPDSEDIPIIINRFNDAEILKSKPKIVSNASCTTYCVAPILDIIERNFGIDYVNFTTIHCYTSDQNLQDGYHTDYRRSRAAGVNIIPTTTSATGVIKKIFPKLSDKISGSSFRVPVINGSITEFTFLLTKQATKSEIEKIIQSEIDTKYTSMVSIIDDKIVSGDILNSPYVAVIDRHSIDVIDRNKLKITAFYDNEAGYTGQLVRLIERF
jgi:glyceraldehyde 3-phosphate dehydrogenase